VQVSEREAIGAANRHICRWRTVFLSYPKKSRSLYHALQTPERSLSLPKSGTELDRACRRVRSVVRLFALADFVAVWAWLQLLLSS
jgi:hypothetical protein